MSGNIDLIIELGPHAWWLYTIMNEMSDENGVCSKTHQELAEKLDISVSSVKRYINKLSNYEIDGERLVTSKRSMDASEYRIAQIWTISSRSLDFNSLKDKQEIAQKRTIQKSNPFMDVWNYWLAEYAQKYSIEYRPSNWSKDKGNMKRLLDRYGGDVEYLKQIIDVVLRLYDSRWKSKQFIRPTIGQLISWLAQQAEPFVVVEQPDPVETSAETSVETSAAENNLFDLISQKWGDEQ